ncbi:hypothetical protein JTB14_022972 [Gonioctena quinquepunctata]|nr:hypothetical protein JTB14_022972 [Gonioctena quinquepunctata]
MGERGAKTGVWIWNDANNSLLFVTREQKDNVIRMHSAGSGGAAVGGTSISSMFQMGKDVAFKDTIGTQSITRFRKHYQRKGKMNEQSVVILQDIKDVAIFLCDIDYLTMEFISYFHTKAMDKFLRSLIIYFQYYFQVWMNMQQRRDEASHKLRQPIVTTLENVIRDDLSDLRSMVARDYAALLTGIGDAKEFHHMNKKNNISLSNKDRKHFETMILLAQRVVWIALKRKYLSLIEMEMNRLFRTNTFNPVLHANYTVFSVSPDEQRILRGKACTTERKLLQRSPAIQEIILDRHDYKMLAIGLTDMGDTDKSRYT